MKAFFRTFFATLAALLVLFLLFVGVGAVALMGDDDGIEDRSWLVIDLYGGMTEFDPPSGVLGEVFGGSPLTLQRILSSMEMATVDDRIEGVIFRFSSNNGAGGGMIDEIRGAIGLVREAGKPVYGFGDSVDRKTYMIAAACDSIFMPRTSYINFIGVGLMSTHVLGTLEKLGVSPQLHRIKDYKGAAELITRKDLSPAVRENYRWLIDDYWTASMETMRLDRGLSEDQVVALMEHAFFTTGEAVEAGIVDRALYWNELEEMLKGEDDDKLLTVALGDYSDTDPEELGLKGEKKIVVVHAQGTIGGRESKVDPLLGVMMGHESVVSDLQEAREDEDVAAIVFRVNSGGGDALTSDMIGHEVEVTAAKIPVVVSMVDVAASGGYHISYRASKIVVDPNGITGSIGSISGKFNIRGFHDKLGISHDFIERGPNGLIFSNQRDFTEKEWERFAEDHWNGFNDWLTDVAEHRGLTFEEAEKLAHGRVWTGRQAKENGLVDETGGLDRAIELARELAEIPEEEKVTVAHYPESKGLIDSILEGNLDLSMAVRWAAYRFVREEMVGTWRALTERPMAVADPIRVN